MEIKAKKHFGQNFLIDESVKDKIIQTIPKEIDLNIVEIGAGLGDLTKRLLESFHVVSYEVDKDLIKHLKRVFSSKIQSGDLLLKEGDVLEFWDKEGSLHSSSYWLIANIPYNISTPILTNALMDDGCKSITLMVQKEFANKLIAKKQGPDFSMLSVFTQIVGDAKILFDVAPTSFNPQPKVISSVVSIEKRDDLKTDLPKLLKFIKKAFSAPRKTLFKNLSNYFDKESVLKSFDTLGIDIKLRPHEIDSSSFFRLFNILN